MEHMIFDVTIRARGQLDKKIVKPENKILFVRADIGCRVNKTWIAASASERSAQPNYPTSKKFMAAKSRHNILLPDKDSNPDNRVRVCRATLHNRAL